MQDIPLGLQSYERQTSFAPPVELVNFYIEADQSQSEPSQVNRLQRPGLAPFTTAAGPVRALYQQDGVQGGQSFAVASDSLQTVAADGSVSDLGTVADDGKSAKFAAAFDKLAVASGGKLYFLSGSTLTEVAIPDSDTDPENRFARDICDLNNYIVMICPDGRFFWINPGESTIDPLDFATAESSADGLVACASLIGELYLFGSSSVEVWQSTGNADLPFQRAAGRNFSKGCMHRDTVKSLDNTLFWLGDNGVVYRSSSVPMRVSNHGIEERIAKRSGDPSALTITYGGHEFYVLKIPGEGSFAYDVESKSWSEFASTGFTEFRPSHALNLASGILLGDAHSGKIWTFDDTRGDDDGEVMLRKVTGTVSIPSRRSIRNDSFALRVGSSAPCSYRLRWHDGQSSYPDNYRMLPARAGVDQLTAYRLGHIRDSFRTFEVSIVDPVIARISSATANEAFQ
ncbi:hypothetical protein [Flavisphingomonas formosensis]|uniref:hypothetical protein n=1 Tax=Flavisphingomonas formosensis TaxID=861534 RepID=UPI0012FB6678|nr:hypothetical protein [Sphingomonas formosensis]